jgi:purine-nucleoside phosphorylase
MTPFAAFARTTAALAPRTAVVLGSGLAAATAAVVERASIGFGDIPGLVPPTIDGHGGRLVVGEWSGVPVLFCFGRVHFYEGHPWNVVTGTMRTVAELGAKRIVLTNAAGGIHSSLSPGGLMAIRGHIKLLEPGAWQVLANGSAMPQPYCPQLIELMRSHEEAAGRELFAGVYAALTGPSYETPAEIRAIAACGADAVGMSTAMEAEEAARLGLEVVGISCITNKAAGLGDSTLDHAEVLVNAKLAVTRMGELLNVLIGERGA